MTITRFAVIAPPALAGVARDYFDRSQLDEIDGLVAALGVSIDLPCVRTESDYFDDKRHVERAFEHVDFKRFVDFPPCKQIYPYPVTVLRMSQPFNHLYHRFAQEVPLPTALVLSNHFQLTHGGERFFNLHSLLAASDTRELLKPRYTAWGKAFRSEFGDDLLLMAVGDDLHAVIACTPERVAAYLDEQGRDLTYAATGYDQLVYHSYNAYSAVTLGNPHAHIRCPQYLQDNPDPLEREVLAFQRRFKLAALTA